MSRKKNTRTTRRRGNSKKNAEPRLRFLTSLRTWIVVAWIGTFSVVAYGLHQLEDYAYDVSVVDARIEWANPPQWLSEANWQHVLPSLERQINLPEETDLYLDSVCPYVAEGLAGSAWIEELQRITKQSDGTIRIFAKFRKPFAMIERHGTAYLVDRHGVRLPEQWSAGALNRGGWIVIRGVEVAVPNPGEKWDGEDLAAGLKLAAFLYQMETAGQLPFRDEIRAIDVSNFDGRRNRRDGHLQLVTTNAGSYIHWGMAPGAEYGVEATAGRKLAMLRELYARAGRFPDRGPIDVRGEDGIRFGQPNYEAATP